MLLLAHEKCPTTCALFEVGPGFTARLRWERTAGVQFPTDKPLTPEDIAGAWKRITDFSSNTTHPESTAEATTLLMQEAGPRSSSKPAPSKVGLRNPVLEKVQSVQMEQGEYAYDNQEGISSIYSSNIVILYNLGIGAKRTNLKWVYEGSPDFEVLPTFGVIPQFATQMRFPFAEILPNFNPVRPIRITSLMSDDASPWRAIPGN